MKEETKNTECQQQECFCRKRFKDILTIAIGSFVGVYCALSLFTALHRPHFHAPMMHHPGMMFGQTGGFKHHQFPAKFAPDKFKGGFEQAKPVENKE